ncbi:MAG: putative toxin-antitoxin system toxin component, PIN family [Ferrimicrobium sp.]
MSEPHRIVLDTNVFVVAVTSREGVSARLLLGAMAGRFQLVASPLPLAELAGVLRRPKFRRYLSIEGAHLFVSTIRELVVIVDDPPEEDDPNTGDPNDDFLVLLVEAAGADVLVSGDPDLTAVQRPGLVVMTPRTFLETMGRA